MLAAMLEENKNVARQWFEQVWNQRSEAAIDRLFHAQGRCYGFPDPESVIVGPEAFKPVHRAFCGAFPDLRLEIDELVAEGDSVAVRWHAQMTHTGDHLGMPASGKPVVLAGSAFIVLKDNQIVDGWNYMDLGAMFQKLRAAA